MMKGKFSLGVLMMALFAMVAISPAYAQPGRGQGRGGGMGQGKGPGMEQGMGEMKGMEHMFEKLELTQAQRDQITAIRERYMAQSQTLMNEVKALREQMIAARKDGNRELAEQLRSQLQPKLEQLRAAHQPMRAEVLAVLTPEQRAKMEQMHQRRGGKGGRGHKHCQDGGDDKVRDGKGNATPGMKRQPQID